MSEIPITAKVPKIVLDVLLVIIAFLPVPIFRFAVYPFKRGFFCGDESISYPYRHDTISTPVLITVGVGLNFLAMVLGELLTLRYKRTSLPADTFEYTSTCGSRPVTTKFVRFLVTFYRVFGAFIFGAVICQTSTDIIKYSIGRLRPHFFSICKPDYGKINCTSLNGQPLYITKDVCTGQDQSKLREARLSHPSGHSSFGFYTMVYLALYIFVRLRGFRFSKLLRPFLMAVVLMMALYCACSRVSDYKHHWSDVLGGGILGTIIALLVALFISNLFKSPRVSISLDQLNGTKSEIHSQEHTGEADVGLVQHD